MELRWPIKPNKFERALDLEIASSRQEHPGIQRVKLFGQIWRRCGKQSWLSKKCK
jgi:hypothetical protein